MFKEEKRFCASVESIRKTMRGFQEEAGIPDFVDNFCDLFEVNDLEEYLFIYRNFKLDFNECPNLAGTPEDELAEFSAKMEESFSIYRRREFDYLSPQPINHSKYRTKDATFDMGTNCCTENQLRKLIFMAKESLVVENGMEEIHPVIFEKWLRWFAPLSDVSNEVYETYDFTRSENVILHIVEELHLPPIQEKYLKYFLELREEYSFSKNEMEILLEAGKNLLCNEDRICQMLDEFLKS